MSFGCNVRREYILGPLENPMLIHPRAWVGVTLLTIALDVGAAAAQQDGRQELARELARLVLDGTVRKEVDEMVGTGVMQNIAVALQERLNRRLLEVERQMLGGIVQRFISEALPPSRTQEIAAEVYARHFDEPELRELLRFQRSDVGRKATRLGPAVMLETAQAVDREIRESPAVDRMLEDLRRVFPILGPSAP